MSTVEQYLRAVEHALSQGQLPLASHILDAALLVFPANADLLNRMAVTCYQRGLSKQAIVYFNRALAAEESPDNRCNLGMALCDDGQFSQALAVIQPIAEHLPEHSMIQFTAARAWHATGNAARALQAISLALKVAPHDADFCLLRAQIAVEQDNWDKALQDVDALLGIGLSMNQHLRLCGLLMQTGQFTRALPQYRALLVRDAGNVEALLGLAAASERANDLDSMRVAIDQVQILPLTKAQAAGLDHLRGKLALRGNDLISACRFMANAFNADVPEPLWKSQVGFDYGQCLDKNGQYADAWHAFNTAHALRSSFKSSLAGDQPMLDFFRLLRAPVSGQWPADIDATDGCPDPVFVVGFPRSGTTLLEQILDARDSLVSFDEQPFLPRTLLSLQKSGINYPEGLSTLDLDTIQKLRAYYFQQTEARVPLQAGRRLVDKNPLNWARLPLIRALFPKAHIILALRHPCDVILSCYMQNLRSSVLDGAFSDFGRIADLYIAMADYWQALAPKLDLPVLISRYEDLVSDPEDSTRQIAEFLDLPWHSDWLDNSTHAKTKAIIHTPSYAQVMQPINAKAMGRWRHYQSFFDPEIMKKLKPAVHAMGYKLD